MSILLLFTLNIPLINYSATKDILHKSSAVNNFIDINFMLN